MSEKRKRSRQAAYYPGLCDELIEYFEDLAEAPVRDLAASEVSDEGYDSKGSKGSMKREVRRICAELPTIEGFARSIGIPSTTVKKWAHIHPDFGVAYARAKDIQRQVLVDRGLTRQYDPSAFMFVAKNITDMVDRQALEHSGPDGGAIPTKVTVEFVRQSGEPK